MVAAGDEVILAYLMREAPALLSHSFLLRSSINQSVNMSLKVAAPSTDEVKAAPREYAIFAQAEPNGDAVNKAVSTVD